MLVRAFITGVSGLKLTAKERAFIGETMRSRDLEKLKEDIEIGVRLAQSLGLDVSDVQLPIP